MSTHDQCPSSAKEGLPASKPAIPGVELGVTGRAYFRGIDELNGTPAFRASVEREFLPGASELDENGRRTFLKLMGAGLALAGVASIPGCRRPDHKILPYSRTVPEEVVPGKALYYATSMPLPGGGAEGLLVETHEGRPTKVEGNPLHPVNQGRSSIWSQASVLELYDPDRLKQPTLLRAGATAETTATWDDFAAWSKGHFGAYDALRGRGLAFVADRRSSPTREAMKAAVLKRWPEARWVDWDPLASDGAVEGLAAALGRPARAAHDLTKARVILSLDRDFLQEGPDALALARQWGNTRRVLRAGDVMSRLYVIESGFSATGAVADHRLRLAPSQISAFAVLVARDVLQMKAAPGSQVLAAALANVKADAAGVPAAWVKAVAKDLVDSAHDARSAVIVGPTQPAWMHALGAALNAVLNNVGQAVAYRALPAEEATANLRPLADLAAAMAAGQVRTLVTLDSNPVYTAPADFKFLEAMLKVPDRVALSVDTNETVAASTWRLNGAHFLEAWGDTRAFDGTVAPVQPMIAPLYAGRSDIEFLSTILGAERVDGYETVRGVWKENMRAWFPGAGADFEALWRRALHDGVAPGQQAPGQAAGAVAFDRVAQAAGGAEFGAAPAAQSLDVVFTASRVADGRYNNNPWLQELGDPATKIVWDNVAMLSPATCAALGLEPSAATDERPTARMAELSLGGRTLRVMAYPVPGVADYTVVLPLGYGREVVGLVGLGTGFDAYKVRSAAGFWAARGATLAPAADGERWRAVASLQTHWSMEGRALVRELDKQAWDVFASEKDESMLADAYGNRSIRKEKDTYGRERLMSLGERLEGGELNHMPAPVAVYKHPYSGTIGEADPAAEAYSSRHAGKPSQAPPPFTQRAQWGMTIDLSTCIGCNVCTIACQAENNIPVVGKAEVIKGREMHWIRVDRYFRAKPGAGTGQAASLDPDGAMFQPVACVHCEYAPCEVVCPVNATVHGPEGHNYMVYNRCIGTRYCANNCPWKVRRFNFFDYGVTKVNGAYMGQEALEGILPGDKRGAHEINPHLIPPRLRERLDEISRMQKNPNVTVRSRGVMEKCTYCIQRTNEAKIEIKLKGLWADREGLPDGYVQTACQQACPTDAIVFGDILDDTAYPQPDGSTVKGSLVSRLRGHTRSYLLLGYLGTRPRTSHLARVNNPNPDLRPPDMTPFGEHGHGHGGGDHEGGGGHGADAGGHSALPASGHFVDRAKAGRDGYVLSLAVLGAHA